MVKRLLYLLFILSALHFDSDKTTVTKWVVINGCWLSVDGSTNINKFSCSIPDYSVPDTILVTRNPNQQVLLNGNIQLDVQLFDCKNPVMTADLRKTLKVKQYPRLIIRFLSISKYPDAATKQAITKGVVQIELAGVLRQFEIDYKTISAENLYINLIGSRKVNFSDFNIEPPRKLGGMIKTNNELNVVFNLRIKVVS